ALSRLSGPSALMAVEGRMAPTRTTGRSYLMVKLRKYAVSSIVFVPWVTTTPATFGSSAKILLMPLASVSRFSSVMFGLPTLTICSKFTLANCWISGTALTSCSPRNAPPLYSAKFVEEAPAPAMVPPVESTQTSGKSFLACSWPQQGVVQARPAASAAIARLNRFMMFPYFILRGGESSRAASSQPIPAEDGLERLRHWFGETQGAVCCGA